MTEPELLTTLREVHQRCERPGPDENLVKLARSATQWKPDSGVAFTQPEPGGEFFLIQGDLSKIRSPRWAWDRRVKLGALNTLVGVGGVGKSTLVRWMLAGLTRGGLPGNLEGEPTNVLVVGEEDGIQEAWLPAVSAMKGDVKRLYSLGHPKRNQGFDLVVDIDELERLVQEHGIRIVFFDQVLDHVGAEFNAHAAKDVRLALGPIKRLASDLDLAVLYANHPNKIRGDVSLRDRTGGSGQFVDVPRSGLFLGYHPQYGSREQGEHRALVRAKGNVGGVPPAIVFRIEKSFELNPVTGEAVEITIVMDLYEDHELAADDVPPHPPKAAGESKSDQVREAMAEMGADGKWRPRKEAEALARALGAGANTFKDVFRQLQMDEVIETRQAGMEKEWRLRNAT